MNIPGHAGLRCRRDMGHAPHRTSARDLEGALLSPLDRLLTIFSEIRPGEGVVGLSMLGSVFLLLTAVYLLKPARDGLLAASGVPGLSDMELKAYSSFGQSFTLLGVVPLYAWIATRLSRRALARALTTFFVANLVAFWLLQPGLLVERVPYLGLVFYLWFGIFNLLAIVQFWSFAADVYSDEGGRRLFPAIAVGATAGSAAGAWITKKLVRSAGFSTYTLLLVGAATLIGSFVLLALADSRRDGRADVEAPAVADEKSMTAGAFRLVVSHRYLFATAIVILIANWVKTNSDNLLFAIVQEVIGGEASARGISDPVLLDRFTADQTTGFYGDFFFWVNFAALLLQSLFASRILKYGGFGSLFLALPALSIVAYPMLAVLPALALFRVTKVLEDSTNYSLFNTATQVLWLPTTWEMKYKGKAAIDTFFVRFGDTLAALTTFVGIQLFTLPARQFFALNAVLALGWLAAAAVVVRENRALLARPAPSNFAPARVITPERPPLFSR
jgi:AAA family ATP:ADP antiporter